MYNQGLDDFLNSFSRQAFGLEWRMLPTLASKKPTEQKNSSLGKRVFSRLAKSSEGIGLTILEMWVLVHPRFLSVRTKYGRSRFSNYIFLSYDIVKECCLGEEKHPIKSSIVFSTKCSWALESPIMCLSLGSDTSLFQRKPILIF